MYTMGQNHIFKVVP